MAARRRRSSSRGEHSSSPRARRASRSLLREGRARHRSRGHTCPRSPDSFSSLNLRVRRGGRRRVDSSTSVPPAAETHSATIASAHSATERFSPAIRRASSSAAAHFVATRAEQATCTGTRSSCGSPAGLSSAGVTARRSSSTARAVRPRTVSRHAASFSGVATPTIRRATVHETSPESTASRNSGSSSRARQTRAHSRAARAPTPRRSRLQSPRQRKPSGSKPRPRSQPTASAPSTGRTCARSPTSSRSRPSASRPRR